MNRLHTPDESSRIPGPREETPARQEPRRLPAGGPHRLASREGDHG